MDIKHKRVFISWTITDTRSDSLAYQLKATCYHIHYFKLNKYRYFYAPLKYILAFFKTIFVLHKERPEVILVQNPPIFAVFVVWLYCVFSKVIFITDSHTGAFDRWRWKRFLWLYRFLARRALINIVHNEPLARCVARWGISTITIGDIPFYLKTDKNYELRKGFNVAVVNTYCDDEPIDEVIEASKRLPNVNFYISGRLSLAPRDIILKASDNVVFTDFVPQEEYVALLKGCNIAISLTTNNFTMQNGAYEAMALERPIITSDWPVLRETFSKGTIHVDNTAGSIVTAIEQIRKNYSCYQNEIKKLRGERHVVWEENFSKLLTIIEYQLKK